MTEERGYSVRTERRRSDVFFFAAMATAILTLVWMGLVAPRFTQTRVWTCVNDSPNHWTCTRD